MRLNLKKNPVTGTRRETNTKFTKPTYDRSYIRVLAHCTPCPRPVKSIYPNIKNPLQHLLRDMCREGLLERLTDGKRNYFVTTDKGFDLFAAGCRRQEEGMLAIVIILMIAFWYLPIPLALKVLMTVFGGLYCLFWLIRVCVEVYLKQKKKPSFKSPLKY